VIRQYNGDMSIESGIGEGTTISIELPVPVTVRPCIRKMNKKFETTAIREQAERSQHREHSVPVFSDFQLRF
jgi:chemotaxis protein histidine kinase CheA